MTTLEAARSGLITDVMQQAAAVEGIDPELLRQRIADGTAIICHNNRRPNGIPLAVGLGLRTKVNANMGASPVSSGTEEEVEKLKWAERWGADTVMDLSTGGNLDEIGRASCRERVSRCV